MVMLVCIANFLRGDHGLPRIVQWLGFDSSLPETSDSPLADISDQAIYQTRQRIGWRPFWWLRRHAVTWLATPAKNPDAFYQGRRLIGIDGTTFTLPDTPENLECFGKSRNQYKHSGFPLMRLVALCELGTRAIVHWIARPYCVWRERDGQATAAFCS